MSGPPREPKSKQSGGDLKISLKPAGLFVLVMIVFFFAGEESNRRDLARCAVSSAQTSTSGRDQPLSLERLTHRHCPTDVSVNPIQVWI
jgi:hypothetical protein